MLEEIQKFGSTDVYTVVLHDEPEKTKHWFRATEISKFLGYSDTFRAVHSHCKDWQYREFQVGKGRPALYICESGVYRLILRSKSQFALEFQDWLTEEVLPKLRETGMYADSTRFSDEEYQRLLAVVVDRDDRIAELQGQKQQQALMLSCLESMEFVTVREFCKRISFTIDGKGALGFREFIDYYYRVDMCEVASYCAENQISQGFFMQSPIEDMRYARKFPAWFLTSFFNDWLIPHLVKKYDTHRLNLDRRNVLLQYQRRYEPGGALMVSF